MSTRPAMKDILVFSVSAFFMCFPHTSFGDMGPAPISEVVGPFARTIFTRHEPIYRENSGGQFFYVINFIDRTFVQASVSDGIDYVVPNAKTTSRSQNIYIDRVTKRNSYIYLMFDQEIGEQRVSGQYVVEVSALLDREGKVSEGSLLNKIPVMLSTMRLCVRGAYNLHCYGIELPPDMKIEGL